MDDAPLPRKCETPGCECDGTLTISPRCHLGAPLDAVLTADVLSLTCAVCNEVAVRFRVTGVVEGM